MKVIINISIVTSLIIGFNLVGRILLSCTGLKINTNKIDLVSIILGLLMSVFIYAAYLTNFKTVLCGIPVILIMIWLFNKGVNKITFNKQYLNKWNYKTLLVILIPTWIWTLFYYVQFNEYTFFENSIYSVHPDMLFYVAIGELLNQTGAENTIGNLNLIETGLECSPYHYFEIYLNNMIQTIFNLNGVISYIQILFPLSLSLISMIISFILKDFLPKIKTHQLIICSFLLVFVGGFSLPISIIEAGGYSMILPNQAVAKYSYPFIFILISIWSLFRESSFKFTLYLWITAVISYTTFAPIAFAMVTTFLINFFFISKSRLKFNYIIFIANIIPICFLVIFYRTFPLIEALNIMKIDVSLALSMSYLELKEFVNIFFGSHIYYWLDYGIYALLFIFIVFHNKKIKSFSYSLKLVINNKLIVPVLIFWGGLLCWGLLRNVHVNAFQTFLVPIALTSNALILILFVSVLAKHDINKKLKILMIMFMFFVSLSGFYKTINDSYIFNRERFSSFKCSSKFYDRTNTVLKKDLMYNNKIAIFNPIKIYSEAYPIGEFLFLQNSKTVLMCISPEILSKDEITNVVAPFHQFKIKNSYMKIENAQLAFIKKNKISYFLTRDKDLVPNNMLEISSLVCEDNENNYFFYKLTTK